MADHSIYRDIAERTGGDIYIGVVGPVRTGKSTFIKRFMESLVLPHITEGYSRERARDEMPQSAAGKTVMTTEPKFIPDEAVNIRVGESGTMRVKMIDCVGYLVDGALGTVEGDHPRMVRTPWSDSPMPFAEAAEMGTHKVITEHATIGMLITTDGSVGELPRSAYVEAEERVVSELRALGKPFAMILNSARPSSQEAIALAYELEAKYSVPVALVSCMDLDAEDIRHILELVLHEFPVAEVRVSLPEWTTALEPTHRVHKAVMEALGHAASRVKRIGDIRDAFADISDGEYVTAATVDEVDLGRGAAKVSLTMADGLYYRILSELSGFEITGEQSLISLLRELSETKAAYDKIAEALRDCDERGYGIVMPDVSD
ncbi:MAG: stage IV sporulation protein A, partial [Clostridia bacterium]|nr:stage IV sporulation protein A [Clostridia bacterium]